MTRASDGQADSVEAAIDTSIERRCPSTHPLMVPRSSL